MRNILLPLFVLLNLSLSAQTQEKSLFWEVSGNGLEKSSYIYGTMHVQDERVFEFSDRVYQSLESADVYCMEINMDSVNQLGVMSKMMLPKGTELKDLITKEEYDSISKFFQDSLGQNIAVYKSMMPIMVSQVISLQDLNIDQELALDVHFASKAKEAGKPVVGLEKMDDQINAITSIPFESQAGMLMKIVRDKMKGTGESEIDDLMDLYVQGDLNGMLEYANEYTGQDQVAELLFSERLLERRNLKMAYGMEILMKKNHSLFVAVGAAHLGGRLGVIQMLRDKGYTVTPAN